MAKNLVSHVRNTMSGATPTLFPSPFLFPPLLPNIPRPFTLPLPRRRVYRHLNAFRDLGREMDDLSDEENELDDEVSNPPLLKRFPKADSLPRSRTLISVGSISLCLSVGL